MNSTDKSEKLFSLYKVVGLGCKDNYSISTNKKNGLTAWMTGPFVVLYDMKKDKQVKFLKNKNNKVFSCLAFNEEGSLLACGEGNCRNSEIVIYDITSLEQEDKIKSALKAHKFGIEKLKFFKNDKFLISIGDSEDKSMQVFNVASSEVVFSSKYNRPILCFDICETFLVLGGAQFLKIWNYEEKDNKKLQVIKNNVDIGKLKEKNFTACVIYSNNPTNEKRVLLLTSDGHLAEMKYLTKQLSRWVHLKTEKGISLCLFDQMLVCGCSDGIIRLFKGDSLEHVVTLHRPPPLGRANIDANIKKINISVTSDEKFADVVTLCYNSFYEKLISIYSDKTFFVWDLKGKNDKIFVDRYNAFHSGSINNMDVLLTQDDILRVVTCSDDKTVKLWNFKVEDFGLSLSSGIVSSLPRKISHIAYSKIIKRIFYYGKNLTHFKFNMEAFINGSNKVEENDLRVDEDFEISSVKFSPDEKYLACGDNIGNLFIYNLSNFEQVNFVSAHNAQISCIDFLNTSNGQYLLATGSVDNLINVIDLAIGIEQDFENYERTVLYDHHAPVTNVLFCVDKLKQTKLVSCSADRSINFYLVNSASSVSLIQKFQEDDLSTYCLAFNPGNNQVVAGHNGRVTMWKTKMCVTDKVFKMRKGDNLLDNFRIAIDPTGSIFAISNNDKFIRIRSVCDGQLITKIQIAESISSLFFSLRNNFLIASSVEGYIYFFKMDVESLPIKPPQPTKEKTKMNNKLKLLQKYMEDDVNLSKNEKVKTLIEKMKNSEDVKLEDFKMLDSYFQKKNEDKPNEENTSNEDGNKEELIKFVNQIDFSSKNKEQENNKNIPADNQNVIQKNNPNANSKSKDSQVIEIKEEKANNEEEEEEENKSDKNVYLDRSTIFEKNLKEISPDAMKKSILNQSRISLTDTYYKKKNTFEMKNEILHIPRNVNIDSIFKKATTILDNKGKEVETKDTKEEKQPLSLIKPKVTPIMEQCSVIKEKDIDTNLTNNIIPTKKTDPINELPINNTEIKTNNFFTKNQPSSEPGNKILNALNSKKNKEKEKEKEKESFHNGALNELQQLISDTNKFVDKIENRVNSSSDLNKPPQNKKDIDEDFDYFSNDGRLSLIKVTDHIPKANNIFRRNLQDAENNDSEVKQLDIIKETEILNNKFNNFTNLKQIDKNILYEIAEDMHSEDLSETNNQKIESTIQTSKFEVSDTFANKDKILANDMNFLFTNTNINNQIAQSQFIDTICNDTISVTQTQINQENTYENVSTNKTDVKSNNSKTEVDKNEFTLVSDNFELSSIVPVKVKKTYNNSIEKFSLSLINKPKEKKLPEQIEELSKQIEKEALGELLSVYKLMKETTYKLEAKLKASGHLQEEKKEEPTDPLMEKYLEKYSQLLLKRIDDKLKKN